MALDKGDFFFIGNGIGVVILLVGVLAVAPQKAKERQDYEAKQKAAAVQATLKPAVQATDQNKGQSEAEGKPPGRTTTSTAETANALLAKRDIKKGETLTPALFVKAALPEDQLQSHIIKPDFDLSDRVATQNITHGQPLLEDDLGKSQ